MFQQSNIIRSPFIPIKGVPLAEVSLSGVWKIYEGGVEAVRDVNIDIPDGSFCVLVGPSGCGKSTSLRMIAGLEEISRGTVSIGGRVVNEVAPKDRDIAMVFQNYALYPHMTVEKNLSFALRLRKTPKDEIRRRVDEAARQLDLTPYLQRKPGALSGGQRQRVALGRAMVREPSAFLFDEPLSNLDAKLRGSTRAELKSLHKRLKTTTVYVTHDQEEAMSLGDMIVVMAAGEVQQLGAPLEVFDRPNNRFVAGFIGTPPMNFIEGSLDRTDAGVRFNAGDLTLAIPEDEYNDETATQLAGGPVPVVLGIRPQAVRALRDAAAVESARRDASLLDFTIHMAEPLGEQTDLHGHTAEGSRLVFRLPSHDGHASSGNLPLAVDQNRLRLFEPGEFGRALSRLAATRSGTSQETPAAGALS